MSGWFAVKRGITSHAVFKGRMDRIGSFLWMIENAAYKPTEIDIGGRPYTVPRGSLCYSQRFMAEKFGMSVKALRTFLKELEGFGIISISTAATGKARETTRTQLSLCNYEKYQSIGNNRETTGKQPGNKEEQINNIPVGTSAVAPAAGADISSLLWTSGVQFLSANGISEKNARTLIGKWRKGRDDGDVLAAIGRAQREGALDVTSFIEGCFRWQKKKNEEPKEGDTIVTPAGIKKVLMGGQWIRDYT